MLNEIQDEDLSLGPHSDFTALLTSAVHDEHPRYSIMQIKHAISSSACASDLDALSIIPLLIGVADFSVDEILALISECGNAKETVISVQESLERLIFLMESEEEPNAFLKLQRLMQLYTGAIKKTKLRKQTPSNTLRPLFAELPHALEKVNEILQQSEGKEILLLFCSMVKSSIEWALKQEDQSDLLAVKTLCKDVFLRGLTNLCNFIDTRLAQQKFESCYPRLFRGKETGRSDESEELIDVVVDVGLELSYSYDDLVRDRSPGALALLAFMLSRKTITIPSPNMLLSDLFPSLVAAVPTHIVLDHCLYILLHILFPDPTTPNSTNLDPEELTPLIYALVSVACLNKDSTTRHIAFRILGTMLTRLPAMERMHTLHEILTESPYPAMCVSGVGLLKDAVLEALNSGTRLSLTPFASPALLQTFGPVVMRTDPPDLFGKPLNDDRLATFIDSQEPKRLVECLGFYYILLSRDESNSTGVRDLGQLKSTEKEFLLPIRTAVKDRLGSESAIRDEHALMALGAIETALERVDGIRAKLSGES